MSFQQAKPVGNPHEKQEVFWEKRRDEGHITLLTIALVSPPHERHVNGKNDFLRTRWNEENAEIAQALAPLVCKGYKEKGIFSYPGHYKERLKYFMKEKGYYSLLRPEIIAMIPQQCTSVLDIGCGTGVLGRYLKEKGAAEVCGIELVHAAALEAARVLDRVIEGDVERIEFPFTPEHFDCIVCADVLEHLIDPWAVTGKLYTLLKPGGCIVASIPNVGFHRVVRALMKGDWRYADAGVLDKSHLRFFTWRSMKALFQDNGFTIEEVHRKVDSGLNMKLLNFVLCNQIKEALVIQYVLCARKKREDT